MLEPWALAWLQAVTAHDGDVTAATRLAAEARERRTSELLASLLAGCPRRRRQAL